MESTNTYAPKITTGVNLIDEAWGGLYRGGSYVVYGQAWSGRSLLTLQFTNAGVKQDERTLFIFPDRPRDLIIQAASIHFDLRSATEKELVKLMRIPPSFKASEMSDGDLRKALLDLAELAKQDEPDRLVIENFSQFAQFEDFDAFQDAFREMLETLELVDTTILFSLGEPANENAKMVVDFISRQVTGTIHIAADEEDPYAMHRKITIIPNIGHLEGAVADYWDLHETIAENAVSAEHLEEEPSSQPEEGDAAGLDETGTESTADAAVLPDTPGFIPGRVRSLAALRAERERQQKLQHSADGSDHSEVDGGFDVEEPLHELVSQPLPPPLPVVESQNAVSPADEKSDSRNQSETQANDPVKVILDDDDDPDTLSFSQIAEINASASNPAQFTDRSAFISELDKQYDRLSAGDHSFLLIAMRMNRTDGGSIRPFDFEFILDLVVDSLCQTDRLFVSHEKERLVILRTDPATDTNDKDFFKSLTSRLQKEAPRQAEHLIQSVAALTVHDGKPFTSAREFLDYLDKS